MAELSGGATFLRGSGQTSAGKLTRRRVFLAAAPAARTCFSRKVTTMSKRIATLASLVCMVAAGCRGGTPTGASVPDRSLYDGGVGMIGGGRSAGIDMIGGGRSGESAPGTDSTTTVTPGS